MTEIEHQEARRERLLALCSQFGIKTTGRAESTSDEDIRPYLEGHSEIGQWCAVTQHDEIVYLIPDFGTPESAQTRAIEYVNDDLFAEYPVMVIDLDYGEELRPDFSSVSWD